MCIVRRYRGQQVGLSPSQKAEAEFSHRCSLLWEVNPRRSHEGL